MSVLLKHTGSTRKRNNYLLPMYADKIEEVQHRIHFGSGEEFFILVLVLSKTSCHHE